MTMNTDTMTMERPVASAMMPMAAGAPSEMSEHERYARCIAISKRVRWDIDKDVIKGRSRRNGSTDGRTALRQTA